MYLILTVAVTIIVAFILGLTGESYLNFSLCIIFCWLLHIFFYQWHDTCCVDLLTCQLLFCVNVQLSRDGENVGASLDDIATEQQEQLVPNAQMEAAATKIQAGFRGSIHTEPFA